MGSCTKHWSNGNMHSHTLPSKLLFCFRQTGQTFKLSSTYIAKTQIQDPSLFWILTGRVSSKLPALQNNGRQYPTRVGSRRWFRRGSDNSMFTQRTPRPICTPAIKMAGCNVDVPTAAPQKNKTLNFNLFQFLSGTAKGTHSRDGGLNLSLSVVSSSGCTSRAPSCSANSLSLRSTTYLVPCLEVHVHD